MWLTLSRIILSLGTCLFAACSTPTQTAQSESLSAPATSVAAQMSEGTDKKNKTSARTRTQKSTRSEEHTSELQSRGHLVCRRLLEKKKDGSSPPCRAYTARGQLR